MRMSSGQWHIRVIACLTSKFVNVLSLRPDFLTVFDKMTKEQDKLKCCNRILTCRVLVLLYEHENTKLLVLKYL